MLSPGDRIHVAAFVLCCSGAVTAMAQTNQLMNPDFRRLRFNLPNPQQGAPGV
ncbi:MAG TPA: hypothetical protein VK636_12315 [Gemmatimonadaceae bacterium]|nr:hypothetical protein [Gemmatimonadaceae bacterium]